MKKVKTLKVISRAVLLNKSYYYYYVKTFTL